MPTINVTGDVNMVLHPNLDIYDPENPPQDAFTQLVIWGDEVYVINNRGQKRRHSSGRSTGKRRSLSFRHDYEPSL